MSPFLDWLIPRFITEEVAVNCYKVQGDEVYDVICAKADPSLEEWEYTHIGVIKCLNFFGYGLFGMLQLDTLRPKHGRYP